ADRRPGARPAVSGRSAPRAGADAGRRRLVPLDRARAAVLPPRGGAVEPGVWRVDAAPAAPLGAHAPGRGQRWVGAADGQEPPHLAAFAAALRPARAGGGGEADRRARPRTATAVKGVTPDARVLQFPPSASARPQDYGQFS